MTSAEIPIIPLEENFLVSFQGDIRDDQLASLKTRLFEKISETKVQGIVLDVSGLSTMDSYMARLLNELAQGAELNGAETFLVGIQPQIAMTLVEMGLTIPGVRAERTVGQALKTLRQERERNE